MIESTDDINRLGKVAVNILDDYDHDRGPFNEPGIIGSITKHMDSPTERALFLTFTTSLNRRRDAERLYRKFERLWDTERWIFDPETLVTAHDYEELVTLFEREGTRFPESDAQVWYEIARTLYESHGSDPVDILETHDYDMQAISEYVRTASGETRFFEHGRKFPALRGAKIRPLWLRLLSNHVHELTRRTGSEIAVDTHIIQITNKICGTNFSENSEHDKERIRRFWRDVCEPAGINPIDIDAPLWYINRGWNSWGEQYLQAKLSDEGLTLGGVDVEPTNAVDIPSRGAYNDRSKWITAVAQTIDTEPKYVREIIDQVEEYEESA